MDSSTVITITVGELNRLARKYRQEHDGKEELGTYTARMQEKEKNS